MARLPVLHVRSAHEPENWAGFPQVRETLAQWGLLNADASIDAIEAQSGITVHKVEIAHNEAVGILANSYCRVALSSSSWQRTARQD